MYLITVLEKRVVTICIVPGGQPTRGGNASAATATAGFPRSSNRRRSSVTTSSCTGGS